MLQGFVFFLFYSESGTPTLHRRRQTTDKNKQCQAETILPLALLPLSGSSWTSYPEILALVGQFRNRKQLVENRRNVSFFGCQKAQQSEWEVVYRHLWVSGTRFTTTLPQLRFLNTEDDKPIAIYVINILCAILNKFQLQGPN